MSRFSNLEFHGDSEEQSRPDPVIKDELYYERQAQAAWEMGNFEQALRSHAKVLEYNAQNVGAWSGQVRSLIELGEFHEAKLWVDKALEQFPHEPELLAAKAVALARLGDVHNAMAFSDAAIEERGDTPYVWLARGDVLLAAKQKQAVSCVEQALLRARNWFVHWLASRIYYYYGKISLALKMAQDGVALNAGQCSLWLQLGLCQVSLGLNSVATNSFNQALQLNPQCHEAVLASRRLARSGLLGRFRGWCRGVFRR